MATQAPATAEREASGSERRNRRRARRLLSVPGEHASRVEPYGILLAVVLAAIWAWWGWKQGAYFGAVMLPGAVLLCAAGALGALGAPTSLRLGLNPPARVALGALVALAGWTLASALWSPAPDVAVADAQRVLVYALAFGLGLWLCNLAGRRMELALAPIAVAGAIVAVATTVALLAGDDIHRYVEVDGTLQYPLGYRNANAAFFFVAVWPALGLAGSRGLDWRLRGLALGAATLCLELGLLSQSRASVIAGAVAVLVFLVASPRRASALGWLVLAVVPALGVVAHLGPLYHAALDNRPLLGELHSAVGAAAIGGVIAIVAGGLAARFGARVAPGPRREAQIDRGVLVGLGAFLLAGVAAFAIAVGNPVDWIGQRVTEFNRGNNGSLHAQTTRFGFNTGTGRGDLWRVAVLEAGRDPLFGAGAGGYRFVHLRERESGSVTVRDAHSAELETLSELGVPGLALLMAAVAAAALGIRRSRRLGPGAAALGAVAFAAGAYWLVHASLDWFWPYAAVTAPVICLAGAACAPAMRTVRASRGGTGRQLIVTAAIIFAASTIPPFLSDRYLSAAFSEWRTDLSGAYSDLDEAARWNPLSEEPQLATGAIARAAGDRGRAIDAFTAATRKRPEDWAPHYYLATIYARSAPRLARAEVDLALELDPKEPALRALRRRLDSAR